MSLRRFCHSSAFIARLSPLYKCCNPSSTASTHRFDTVSGVFICQIAMYTLTFPPHDADRANPGRKHPLARTAEATVQVTKSFPFVNFPRISSQLRTGRYTSAQFMLISRLALGSLLVLNKSEVKPFSLSLCIHSRHTEPLVISATGLTTILHPEKLTGLLLAGVAYGDILSA